MALRMDTQFAASEASCWRGGFTARKGRRSVPRETRPPRAICLAGPPGARDGGNHGRVCLQSSGSVCGSLLPSLLVRRRRVDPARFAAVMEADLRGDLGTVASDLMKVLGAVAGIRKSEASPVCADVNSEVGADRDRSQPIG